MRESARRLMGKVGMALGIMVIVGSVVGGVALAADLGRTDDQTDSNVPAGDNGTSTPGEAVTPSDLASTTQPAGAGAATPDAATGEPGTTPQPDPTCWAGPGEHPPGIEDCEDR